VDDAVTAEVPFSSSAPLETRKQALKSSLKRSQFIVGVARAFKGLISDVRVMVWLARRNRVVTDYLNNHPVKKLQLGASNNLLPDWLNTDVCVNHMSVAYLDATRPFPFACNTFDYIMSEHMIEHVPYHAARTTLQECYRVLRPGGRVRFATPDLRVLLALHNKEKTEDQIRYIDWAIARFMPNVQGCRDIFVINNFFYSWGHCFLYDKETLQHVLQTAGFGGIKFYKPGASDDSNLKNLEFHGKELKSEDINQFETIIVEGTKGA
jgi:predicted SAM-dependent methyltransferase